VLDDQVETAEMEKPEIEKVRIAAPAEPAKSGSKTWMLWGLAVAAVAAVFFLMR